MKKFVLMWLALLGAVCGLCCVSAHSQSEGSSAGSQSGALASQAVPGALSPAEQAQRDAMLDPALAKLKAGDPAGAYDALRPVLLAYPQDLRVLRYAAQAAELTGHDEEALNLFTRALALNPNQPWPLRLGRMQEEAKLGLWPAFNADLQTLRAAKKAEDPALARSNGFVIDDFEANGIKVQAVIFPLLAGRFHTLYRFLLPAGSSTQASVTASATAPAQGADGKPNPCANPNFRPSIDVESDDVDQVAFGKAHPELAAKGERSYSLDTYPAPCAQGLIKFYNDGEPSYEMARADVIAAVGKAKK